MKRRHRWHKTEQRGVYYEVEPDGTRTYIATWHEERPTNIADPLTMRRERVERRASTFDGACRLQAEGEAAARERGTYQSRASRLGERMMAAKWFEYWVRR